MYAEVTVKWAVVPGKSVELYKLAGSEDAIQQRLVFPDSREIVRNVFARYTSEQGYASDREKINAEIATLVKERLAPRGIDVTTVNLRNVKPSEALQARSTARSSSSRPPSGPPRPPAPPRPSPTGAGSRRRASPAPTRSSTTR